jgi:hypothetical protein
MVPEDVRKITLITKKRLYDWTFMPFGLKDTTSTFRRTMYEVFKDLGDKFLNIFVDGLDIHSKNWEEHLTHLHAIFGRLKEVNLKFNLSKCCFVANNITFLGRVVNKEGTKLNLGKINVTIHCPQPKILTNIRSILGLTRYYRNYVWGYA